MKFLTLILLIWKVGNINGEDCVARQYGEGKIVCVCNATYCDTLPSGFKVSDGEFLAFQSSKEGQRFRSVGGKFQDSHNEADTVFSVNREVTYQKMFGFGGAMTDAAGINIASLSENAQQNVLRSYFAPEGSQYNMIRIPMGGSDFSTRPYSYDDVEGDVTLEHFELAEEDIKYKIPFIKKAKELNPRNILLFGAPWSAPKWMKTNNEFNGAGQLKGEYYQPWADYFVRFFDAYAKEDLQFWGISPQNEPSDGFVPNFSFSCMGWSDDGERDWIASYLGPAIKQSDHNNVKLMIMDDQRPFLSSWAETMLTNETVQDYVSGIAVHWYMDFFSSPSVLTEVHDAYPDTFLLYTEACNGAINNKVDLGSWENGEAYAKDIIETTNNWVTGWVDWNLALDEQGGPNWANNFVDAPVIVNATADEFYKQPMYYMLAHFSKFVPEGSQRIELSTSDNKGIENVAFVDPDGNTVIVFLNRNDEAVSVAVADPDHGEFNLGIDARSIITILY